MAPALCPQVSTFRGIDPLRQDEGQAFQPVFEPADKLASAQLHKLNIDPVAVHERGRYFALDASAHFTEKSANFNPENVARLRAAWGRFWDENKTVLVEKSPPDLIRMRYLSAAFPPAFFLVIARHPLSVCRRVHPRFFILCLRNWLNAYEWAHADVVTGNLTYFWTFYEVWADSPVNEMEAMMPVLAFNASRSGNFSWADVLVTGADVGLRQHSKSGWGYVGKEGDWRETSMAKQPPGRVFVDNHRLLPDQGMDALQDGDPDRREAMERMEGRLRRFGYSFFAPFVTGCPIERRRRAACDIDNVAFPELPPISEAAREAAADARRRAFRISVVGGEPEELPGGSRAAMRKRGIPIREWQSRGAAAARSAANLPHVMKRMEAALAARARAEQENEAEWSDGTAEEEEGEDESGGEDERRDGGGAGEEGLAEGGTGRDGAAWVKGAVAQQEGPAGGKEPESGIGEEGHEFLLTTTTTSTEETAPGRSGGGAAGEAAAAAAEAAAAEAERSRRRLIIPSAAVWQEAVRGV